MNLSPFVVSLCVVTAWSCGVRREIVDFNDACTGKPNRIVAVKGYIAKGNTTCVSNAGTRDCNLTLADTHRVRNILFTLKEGNGPNQIQTHETDALTKASVSTFAADAVKVRGENGNVLDLEKMVVLSGKTTLLVSSSMASVCKLDEAQITQ